MVNTARSKLTELQGNKLLLIIRYKTTDDATQKSRNKKVDTCLKAFPYRCGIYHRHIRCGLRKRLHLIHNPGSYISCIHNRQNYHTQNNHTGYRLQWRYPDK